MQQQAAEVKASWKGYPLCSGRVAFEQQRVCVLVGGYCGSPVEPDEDPCSFDTSLSYLETNYCFYSVLINWGPLLGMAQSVTPNLAKLFRKLYYYCCERIR